jgi:hypothetical protein
MIKRLTCGFTAGEALLRALGDHLLARSAVITTVLLSD